MGCIFGELLKNTPLMPGQTEIDQLVMMAKLLGSPSDKIWYAVRQREATCFVLIVEFLLF